MANSEDGTSRRCFMLSRRMPNWVVDVERHGVANVSFKISVECREQLRNCSNPPAVLTWAVSDGAKLRRSGRRRRRRYGRTDGSVAPQPNILAIYVLSVWYLRNFIDDLQRWRSKARLQRSRWNMSYTKALESGALA